MQINVSSAVAYDFNQLLHALCALPLTADLEPCPTPPEDFWPCHALSHPAPRKNLSLSIPVFIQLCRKYVIASVNYSFVSINSQYLGVAEEKKSVKLITMAGPLLRQYFFL